MNKIFIFFRYNLPLHLVLLLTNWLPDNVPFLKLRGYLASPFFGSCGKNLRLGRNLTFYNSKNIFIGSNVYIAYNNWFSASKKGITIEDEVMFGPMSIIASSNHTRHKGSFRYGDTKDKSIKVGKGTWVSANCTITAGSKVGSGCLIASNTVVSNEVSPNSVFGGVPGKVIKNKVSSCD